MRLIDAEKVRKDFMNTVYTECESDSTNDRANRIIDAFDTLPKVETEPVKPGKWEIRPCGWSDYDCIYSVCGESGTPDYKYCHECGAKMDGGVEN